MLSTISFHENNATPSHTAMYDVMYQKKTYYDLSLVFQEVCVCDYGGEKRSSGATVINSCGLLNVGAESRTWVLWKGRGWSVSSGKGDGDSCQECQGWRAGLFGVFLVQSLS